MMGVPACSERSEAPAKHHFKQSPAGSSVVVDFQRAAVNLLKPDVVITLFHHRFYRIRLNGRYWELKTLRVTIAVDNAEKEFNFIKSNIVCRWTKLSDMPRAPTSSLVRYKTASCIIHYCVVESFDRESLSEEFKRASICWSTSGNFGSATSDSTESILHIDSNVEYASGSE